MAIPVRLDLCTAIAGASYATPADVLACLRSFPFNETLRQNILSTVSKVFDFYTFEDYYPKSSAPFPNMRHIRAGLARINTTSYSTDYDFNLDLYNFVNQLNDGHTLWLPSCYVTWESLLPTPVVSISVSGMEGVYIAPDAVDFMALLPPGFTEFYDSIGFNWQRLAGARVLRIEGMDPYDYVDWVADTVTGNYLDHGVRVNSVFTSYRLSGSSFSQKFGDLAGRVFSPVENLTWAINCAANGNTNGVDRRRTPNSLQLRPRLQPKGLSRPPSDAIGLPPKFQPSLPPVNNNASVMVSYLLPDGITGILFIGSFQDSDFEQFQVDVVATINSLKAAGATRLLIDLTNNPGGFICQGLFLHHGFQSAVRGNLLAQKIVREVIAQSISEDVSFYVPSQWASLNDALFLDNYNYIDPPIDVDINGRMDATSQRFRDACPFSVPISSLPPFDLTRVAIVTNGNCASTCAMFSTLMKERHNTTIAVFGGRPGQGIEFKGMAGNQVLEWADLDSEIKTAGLKDDPLAPPDLLVSANMRHNWRTAYSYLDEATPIGSSRTVRFPYTADTYNDPQNLWIFA
ncbi:hypothetical protein B0F90DRAFT_1810692 [Multifurca ochricompacta]|uniref:Tail specific protease domain-containing protein n=1 Tax=Multifurca ochricompacta TaxID=376703 RepID=A0AAD4QMY5_9AGAM|nr:hypothetical protein B0F90DRAFT_1810692 [Multifurca ochricompacta]